ncbi:hypothetical protein LMG22037_04668 [Paraburkholderia phenoliruptrix]|uniref:Uncharacterized protein n=1 Tax=Paraburkholderia phenoliruptrix TaxID=252970 RepID=A0A6J5BXY2_9BURK|nr:hypothetical protein [Paraburkholderia phenoliruptrix]CAB3719850.1 hypothetical protein LMG22037_04668 [Paraburkholderia phenoliruptrix]
MTKRNLFAEVRDGMDALAAGRGGKSVIEKIPYKDYLIIVRLELMEGGGAKIHSQTIQKGESGTPYEVAVDTNVTGMYRNESEAISAAVRTARPMIDEFASGRSSLP